MLSDLKTVDLFLFYILLFKFLLFFYFDSFLFFYHIFSDIYASGADNTLFPTTINLKTKDPVFLIKSIESK